MTADQLCLCVEKKGQRQAAFLKAGRYGPPLIIVGRKILHMQFFEKRQDDFGASVIDRNRDHGHAACRQ